MWSALPFNWPAGVLCSCGRPKTLTASHTSTIDNKTNRRLILLIVIPPIWKHMCKTKIKPLCVTVDNVIFYLYISRALCVKCTKERERYSRIVILIIVRVLRLWNTHGNSVRVVFNLGRVEKYWQTVMEKKIQIQK